MPRLSTLTVWNGIGAGMLMGLQTISMARCIAAKSLDAHTPDVLILATEDRSIYHIWTTARMGKLTRRATWKLSALGWEHYANTIVHASSGRRQLSNAKRPSGADRR